MIEGDSCYDEAVRRVGDVSSPGFELVLSLDVESVWTFRDGSACSLTCVGSCLPNSLNVAVTVAHEVRW